MKGSKELKFDPARLLYKGIIGTGGIGSGKFFILNGDHTLGREESRSGRFLDINDYCKQHIILHYIKVLLGRSFKVIPVGKVGADDIGEKLFKEMEETGFEMSLIQKEPGSSTLFSFCFYYPDGNGGNLTTDNSASSMVDGGFIDMALPEITRLGDQGMIMAAPEVPLEARAKLIGLGKKNGLFCAASFTTGEIKELLRSNILGMCDLIAINADEAASFAGMDDIAHDKAEMVSRTVQNLMKHNSKIMVSITSGGEGSWCWDGHELNRCPAAKVSPVSTAGAGDAFFAGILAGLALGLDLFSSQQLATLIAGLSVCSVHTINREIDRNALKLFSGNSGIPLSENVLKLLEE
jgi:ribokinase